MPDEVEARGVVRGCGRLRRRGGVEDAGRWRGMAMESIREVRWKEGTAAVEKTMATAPSALWAEGRDCRRREGGVTTVIPGVGVVVGK